MSDLISRQAAIEVADAVWAVTGDKNVAKVLDQIKDLPPAQPDVPDINVGKICEYYDLCRNGRDEKKLREELLSAQPGWIPVMERLPEDNEEVLFCDNEGEQWLGWHYGFWKTERLDFNEDDVVAWMPLPKPWEGGQDNGAD